MIKKILFLLVLAVLLLPSSEVGGESLKSIYDGYIDHWGNLVPGYIDNDTWMTPAPSYITGNLVFYGPYAMDATAEYRGIDYEEQGCLGGISLMSPMDIGKKAWIRIDGEWRGPYCVVDCARRGDMYSIIVYRDEVVEVNFDLALELGMVTMNSDYSYNVHEWRKENVVVYVQNCSGSYPDLLSEEARNPVDYSDWFLENLNFIYRQEDTPMPRDDYLYWKVGYTGVTYSDFRRYVPCEIVKDKDG